MQKFSYHTHTNGLFDGMNTIDEMIAMAQEKGFESYGISNHLTCHPNIPTYSKMFLHDYKSALPIYQRTIDEIRAAAERYHIAVRVGFEVDFFMDPKWRDAFEKMRPQLEVDYLIGAIHFLQAPDGSSAYGLYDPERSPEQTQAFLPNYWRAVKEAIQSGYFNWMAHLDLLKYFKLNRPSDWEHEQEIAELLAKNKMATELNTSAMRRGLGEFYPANDFIACLNENGVRLLVSDDAHRAIDLGADFDKADELLTRLSYQNRIMEKDFFLSSTN